MKRVLSSALLAVVAASALGAQSAATLAQNVRQQYVSVAEPVVALTNVTVIDGTGRNAPQPNQTIVIRDGRIADVGRTGSVRVPANARTLDLPGHTVIPGIVGMHDHLFYSGGGRTAQMSFTGPRLYLGSGVTTIRTTGGRQPYAEINTRDAIDAGRSPGPRIHLTAPYITGGSRGSAGMMAEITTPEEARRFVAYWAQEGMTWVKAYTNIRRAELGAAIEEAHKRGMKVTGHLCSVSFMEAVQLGIDNLEHGLLTNTDFDPRKEPDVCPSGSGGRVAQASMTSDTARSVIQTMVSRGVGMNSTLAVYEPFFPNRPTKDDRTLEAMSPEVREGYLRVRARIDSSAGRGTYNAATLRNMMAFEKAFFDAGGILGAGVDPTGNGGALPGFGDQRNYELFIEAGFTPPQAVQILTLNGARNLGVANQLGSIERGKLADLVVLRGDLAADPSVIRATTIVFKDGVGFDSAKLIASVKGRVGID